MFEIKPLLELVNLEQLFLLVGIILLLGDGILQLMVSQMQVKRIFIIDIKEERMLPVLVTFIRGSVQSQGTRKT